MAAVVLNACKKWFSLFNFLCPGKKRKKIGVKDLIQKRAHAHVCHLKFRKKADMLWAFMLDFFSHQQQHRIVDYYLNK